MHPDRRALRHIRQPALVAALRHLGVGHDLGQMLHIFARFEQSVRLRQRQVVVAHIVGAPLEQRHRHRRFQRIAHHRQVFLEQLVLQVLGAGGDHHLAARQQRRHQIGEGLARARARLGHEDGVVAYRLRHGQRHFALLRAWTERRDFSGKRALFGKETFYFDGHGKGIGGDIGRKVYGISRE